MIRTLLASFLLLVGLMAFSPTAGDAKGNATLSAVPYVLGFRCPFSIDNGCANSIAGQPGSAAVLLSNSRQSPSNSNMVNQLTASTTDYSNQPGTRFAMENFPAVDYWVGEYTPLTKLKDPLDATVGIVATNPSCAYLPTGNVGGGPQITCTTSGTANATIIGYDMTRGGTTCIAMEQKGGSTGTWDVEDNYWLNDGRCTAKDTTRGNTGAMIDGGLAAGTNIFKYNTLDANHQNFPYYWGACSPSAAVACNPTAMTLLVGDTKEQYNAFLNFPERSLQYSMFLATAGLDFSYNLYQNCCSDDGGAHGEFFLATAQSTAGTVSQLTSGEVFKGNTILSTTAHHNVGDAAFDVTFAGLSFVPNVDFEDNFYVAGTSGGATQSARVTGTTSGAVFTTSAITGGTYGSGEITSCRTAAGNGLTFLPIYAGLTGSVSAGPGGGGNSGAIKAGSFVNGTSYAILSVGTTNFTLIGASSNTVGVVFTASGAGSGTGTAAAQVSSWNMTEQGTAGTNEFQGSLDDGTGTGTAGNVLTVTDSSMVMATAGTQGPLDAGMGISMLGVTRVITAMAPSLDPLGTPYTGTGNAGTYGVSGAAALVAPSSTRYAAVPHNIFPGGWAANTCTVTNGTVNGAGFNIAWFNLVGLIGQFTSANNTMDLFAFNGSGLGVTTSNSAALRTFNGTISGSTLTVNSGTAPAIDDAIFPGSGVLAHTWVASGSSPTFTLDGATYTGTVGPQTMVGSQTACDFASVVTGNLDLSGSYTPTQVNTLVSNQIGTGC